MKKVPIKEVMGKATKERLYVDYAVPAILINGNYETYVIRVPSCDRSVATLWAGGGTHGKSLQRANAALMAHWFKEGPKLLEALVEYTDCDEAQPFSPAGNPEYDQAVKAIKEASLVEVPE